jgi:O-antigen/teichoic acid export membrane protein
MSVRRALGISASSSLITFALNFVSVVVVSRLLTPTEIGVFSVAVAILGLAHMFREFGVGQYIVQAKEFDEEQFRAAIAVTLVTSWSIALLLYLARVPLASFYRHEGVAEVLTLMALNFVIMPFGTPLMALMQRDLEFKKLAGLRIANAAASTGTTMLTAWAGESYLSMAWGAIAGHVTNVVMLNVMRPGRVFVWPRFKGFRQVFRFGTMASASSLLTELGSSMPSFILGRTLGFASVAFYSRAYSLRAMLLNHVLKIVRGVYFPVFSRGLRDGQNPAKLYTESVVRLVGVTGPMMLVSAALAQPLILLLFGWQWHRSANLATLICIYAALGTPYSLAPSSLIASGHIKHILPVQGVVEAIRFAVLICSIWIELEMVVMSLVLVTLISNWLQQRALQRAIALNFLAFGRALLPTVGVAAAALAGPRSLCVS